jgi:hypothetical protein
MNVTASNTPTHALPTADPRPFRTPTVLAAKGPSELFTLDICSGISNGKVTILHIPLPNFVAGPLNFSAISSQKAGVAELTINDNTIAAKNSFFIVLSPSC